MNTRVLSLTLLLGLFFLTNCKKTSVTKPEKKVDSEITITKFLSHTPDSINKPTKEAISQLREKKSVSSFARKFINNKGFPAWDYTSTIRQNGHLILLVPVVDYNKKYVAGIWNIRFQDKNPEFYWMPRYLAPNTTTNLTKGALEVIMLGFQREIFPHSTTRGLKVSVKKESSRIDLEDGQVLSRWRRVQVDERCYRVDVEGLYNRNSERTESYLDYYYGNWQCEPIYDWVYFPDDRDGGSDDGRDGTGGTGGTSGTHSGSVIADQSIKNNDKTDCVFNQLNYSNTFTELIANFEGGNSTFDLVFELTEIPGNPLGNLKGENPNDFVAQIDVSQMLSRSDLGVASTFLHEAMHAEMRRYLYNKQENGSSIEGFPGTFTEDWNNYVEEKYGKTNVGQAEHEAMGEYFVGFIANALEEFDNSQLDRAYYEAVAWDGLRGTEAWDSNENKDELNDKRDDGKISERPSQCN